VCFADEPEAFAAAVIALLGDQQRAVALGRAARDHVEAHFGWDAIVPLMEGVYR
jgi:polysaccharide biosynthesis protein PslH